MKKLLSILGTMALTTTASTSVIACGNPQEKQDLENSNQKLKDEKDKLEKDTQKLKDEKDKLEKDTQKLWIIYREIKYIPDSAFSKNITIEIGKDKDIASIKESDLNIALPPKIKEELNKFHNDIGEDDFKLSYSCFVWPIETIDLTKYKLVKVRITGLDDTKIKGAKTVDIVLKAITKSK